jgi:1,6-anhydro-N-acetylmuramate kinase
MGHPFADVLRELANAGAATAERIATAARDYSEFHAEVVGEAIAHAGVGSVDLVSVHGQTVFHRAPVSWQLFNPWPLVRRVGAPVVFDLRGADLAAGGQGAPITPLADWVLFRRPSRVVVVNLGGFCNVTRLPVDRGDPGGIVAGDVCACNHVLDGVARLSLGREFDEDGAAAAAGRVHEEAVRDLEMALASQAGSRRSLGTGDEAGAWAHRWRERLGHDLVRCAVEGVARVVARACDGGGGVLLAGGGARNRVLARRIAELVGGEVTTTASAGVPIESREAACMAVLGALCQDRVAVTLPRVTGVAAPAPIAGCWACP